MKSTYFIIKIVKYFLVNTTELLLKVLITCWQNIIDYGHGSLNALNLTCKNGFILKCVLWTNYKCSQSRCTNYNGYGFNSRLFGTLRSWHLSII